MVLYSRAFLVLRGKIKISSCYTRQKISSCYTRQKISSCHKRQKTPQPRASRSFFIAMLCKATMRTSRSYLYMRRPCSFSISILQWHRRRPYSIQSQEEHIVQLPDINPSALTITRATSPKQVLTPEELVFGRAFTGKHATAFPISNHTSC